ncbi:hypothetical protein FACS1894139_02600 [Planctomycetales bacterium]|nr:hypothetical protein FACS1894108_12160 [Planctomycetales bacterium]GHT03102.1 hypothetical protein FACS1894139_02600 [Planctomycetales bacterium]GHV22270.1 hypothetical protein AGMMS49959_12800 [Planctomycetales bacterium]
MAERAVWGIDLGQNAIRAVRMHSPDGENAIISNIFLQPLNSEPEAPERPDEIKDALAAFAAQNLDRVPVVLSVSGMSVLFRLFAIPAVSEGKLREVISYEAKQLIPYPLEEVVFDFQTLGVNADSGEMQIALLCCRRDIIDDLLAITDELKIEVADIQVAPLALVNFCAFDFFEEGRMLLLDAGARSTDFIIFDENIFWLRSIPNNGNDMIRELAEKYETTFAEARGLISTTGNSKQTAMIFETLAPLYRDLAAEVRRSIGFYRSTKRDATIGEMILVGNGFRLYGVDQLMADELGYATSSFDLPRRITIEGNITEDDLLPYRASYGIAAGLALQGLGLVKYPSSLLPEKRRFAKLIKKKEPYGWLCAAVILLMVLIESVTNVSHRPIYELQMTEIDRLLHESSARYQAYAEMLEKFRPVQEVNDRLADVGQGRGALAAASQQLHKTIREFSDLQQKPLFKETLGGTGVNLREFERRARTNITGYSPSNLEYRRLLEEKTNNSRREGGFREDFNSIGNLKNADELRAEMNANLELQALRYVLIKHLRRNRVFVSSEDYQVVEAVKKFATIDGEITATWQVLSPEDAAQLRAAAAKKRSVAGEGEEVDAAQTAVVAEISGFIVDGGAVGGVTGADMLTRLKDHFSRQQTRGFYLLGNAQIEDGFTIVREQNRNAINLPVIYSPLPKEIRDDELGEKRELNRAENLRWQPVEEEIHSFRARLLFEPKSVQLTNNGYRALMTDAEKAIRAAFAPEDRAPVTPAAKAAE